jgi:hypothetical protein
MKKQMSISKTVICLTIALLMAASLGAVRAVAEPMEKIINIPPFAFVEGDVSTSCHWDWGDGNISLDGPSCCVQTPVNFPEGAAKIKYVKGIAHSDGAAFKPYFVLYRINLKTGATKELGSITSVDTDGPEGFKIPLSRKEKKLSNDYAYQLGACILSSNGYIYGATIKYTNGP